ncbi:MAG: PIN domain-containing protein [Spirochaetales bacterium]|nr:PIN domain-containing protein [Spirochaetales bacterium]
MRKLKLYLDTSVINFIYADDMPDLRKVTIDFFEDYIKPQKYEAYISDVVSLEISRTRDQEKRKNLFSIIETYNLRVLPTEREDEIKYLVTKYMEKGIIPKNKIEDALHIAYAVVYEMDYLISWNYRHLANINKEKRILLLNEEENYHHYFRMITPLEVLYEE